MLGLFTYLGAIALADSINPTATMLQVYLLSTPNSVRRSITFILGVFIAYFCAGWLFILGFAKILTSFIESIGSFIDILQFILGATMLVIAFRMKPSNEFDKNIKKPQVSNPINTFILGLSVTFLEAPTALPLPYIVAIERIVQSKFQFCLSSQYTAFSHSL